jgi:regulator of RNase E activity RraA
MWGELMSRTARARGAVGAVVGGPMRDTPAIRAIEFPVFSTGSYARDQRGRGQVTDYRCTLELGGVTVDDGDVVVGDEDGVLIIPSASLGECLKRAVEKIGIEDQIGELLEGGADSAAMFDKFGVM